MPTDLLVLGTGVTGRQTIRYLQTHPARASFTFSIAGRSQSKLDVLVSELALPKDVDVLVVDVKNVEQVEAAVKTAKVVLNTVGPYWLYGTPVVGACVRNGVNYVDLTGEAHWVKDIIQAYDYYATKTHSIIVPCCGIDCIPSDITTYLSRKTIASTDRDAFVPIAKSVSACKMSGIMSGGTAATIITAIESVPRATRRWANSSHALSPIVGTPNGPFKFLYSLTIPLSSRTLVGGHHMMSLVDRAIVQRSFGLLEYNAIISPNKETQRARYGKDFEYAEFMVTPSKVTGFLLSFGLILGMVSLLIPGLSYFVKKLLPQPGTGLKDADVQEGFLDVTNVTTAASGNKHAVTTFKAKGDPGYYLSCIMLAECALALLPSETHKLPQFAQQGGVLTPATAFGDVLVERLNKTGIFKVESELIAPKDSDRVY